MTRRDRMIVNYAVFDLVIQFMNGSVDTLHFSNALDAREYARDKISYSGNRVRQVELREHGKDQGEVLWNIEWNAVSKAARLRIK